MRLTLGLTLLISFTNLSFSCEPASVDWQRFMADYDRDADGFISASEFVNVLDFLPYDFPREQDISRTDLFRFLDADKNSQIDANEFVAIYQILPNGCLLFDRSGN